MVSEVLLLKFEGSPKTLLFSCLTKVPEQNCGGHILINVYWCRHAVINFWKFNDMFLSLNISNLHFIWSLRSKSIKLKQIHDINPKLKKNTENRLLFQWQHSTTTTVQSFILDLPTCACWKSNQLENIWNFIRSIVQLNKQYYVNK